jgi:hypothetical protein
MCQNSPLLYYRGPRVVCRNSYRFLKRKVQNSDIVIGTDKLVRGTYSLTSRCIKMVHKRNGHQSRCSIFFVLGLVIYIRSNLAADVLV